MSYNFGMLKLLIADGNRNARTVLQTIARNLGFRHIFTAANREQLANVLASNDIDLLFIDAELQGDDGLALVQDLREGRFGNDAFLPIIMIASAPSQALVTMARDCGATEFLAKPVTPRTLVDRLISIIERPRQFVRAPKFFGPCRRRRRDSSGYEGENRRGENHVATPDGNIAAEQNTAHSMLPR